MASSPSQPVSSPAESDPKFSALVYDMSQQIQIAMDNMFKMINEIEQNSAGIMEEIGKCRGAALERKRDLEEEKERFQKAAYTVLDMLSRRD